MTDNRALVLLGKIVNGATPTTRLWNATHPFWI